MSVSRKLIPLVKKQKKSGHELPFKEGDLVNFSTPCYRGWGEVVGMAPGMQGFCNYSVVVKHNQLEVLKPDLPFAPFSTLVMDVYDPIDLLDGVNEDTARYVTLMRETQ